LTLTPYDRTATIRAVAIALGLALLAAGVFLALQRGGSERRTLFFPEFQSRLLIGEVRYLPARESVADDVRLLLEELVLGPANHEAVTVVPRSVRVLSVHVLGEEAVINLTRHVLFDPTPVPYSRAERLHAVANTVLFNLRTLSAVRTLVEGQEPELGANATVGGVPGQLRFAKSLLR
jgi:hypothetical protein